MRDENARNPRSHRHRGAARAKSSTTMPYRPGTAGPPPTATSSLARAPVATSAKVGRRCCSPEVERDPAIRPIVAVDRGQPRAEPNVDFATAKDRCRRIKECGDGFSGHTLHHAALRLDHDHVAALQQRSTAATSRPMIAGAADDHALCARPAPGRSAPHVIDLAQRIAPRRSPMPGSSRIARARCRSRTPDCRSQWVRTIAQADLSCVRQV